MRKSTVLAAAMILGLFVASCKKDVYNEKKLTGSWTVQEYKVGTTDLLKDSLQTNVGTTGVYKTKFNSATIVFEDGGDFIENISYGASVTSTYYGYSYAYQLPTQTSISNGAWTESGSDLLMTFNAGTGYDYLSYYNSPANSMFMTGVYSQQYNFTEKYDIILLTKKELEMEMTNVAGQTVYIKAVKN